MYHGGAGANGGQQLMGDLYDVSKKKLLARMPVPLGSASATLTWAGFTDSGNPAVADSDEVIKVLTQGTPLPIPSQ